MAEMTAPAEANNLQDDEVQYDEGYFHVRINELPKLYEYLVNGRDRKKNYVQRYIAQNPDLDYVLKIPRGKYDTPEDLVEKMQDVFDAQYKTPWSPMWDQRLEFCFNTRNFNTQRLKVLFKHTQNKIEVGFSESLLTRLGGVADPEVAYVMKSHPATPHYVSRTQDSFHISKYPIDLNMVMNLLYVYSDLVQHNMVGDQWAPLLRVIPFSTKKEASLLPNGSVQNYYEFQHPQYLPLAKTEFDTIETSIRGDTGNPISFVQGKTVVTLHFRKARK